MLTYILIFFPLLAGLACFGVSKEVARRVALVASLVELGLAMAAYFTFKIEPTSDLLRVNLNWLPSIGVHFRVEMDGISLLMVLLTTLLMPFIILSSFSQTYRKANTLYGLMLMMQMALVGVFTAADGFLFYVFWELALIPIYFICLVWGGENRGKITFKFFIYTLFGSLFMLVALLYLYTKSPGQTFGIEDLYIAGRTLPIEGQNFVFWAMFLAFAIKMPIFPFHTWQPDTYTNAPTPGTMLLSGIMLKMGTYGLIRWLAPVVPAALESNKFMAMALAVISIVYASAIAIAQKDFKRMIAYSSIAHVGLIAAGIMAFNVQGLQGGLIQMISHGINVIGLFFIYDIISRRIGTGDMAQMGGIRGVAPQFALLFLFVLLGSVALPLTNGFVGEFLLLNGVYQYDFWMAAFAGLTVILGAVYMLRSYQTMMLGETSSKTNTFMDLTASEKWVLIPLAILVIAIGVYPKPLLDLTESAVTNLVNGMSLGIK